MNSELRATLKTGVWNTIPSPEAQMVKLMKQKYRRERRLLEAASTKDMNSNELRATLKTGVWNTVPSPEAQMVKLMKQKYR